MSSFKIGLNFIFEYWQKLKIASKFTTAFGVLQILIIMVGFTGLIALTTIRYQLETTILTSSEIRAIVLEMNLNMEKSRRLQRDFFVNYVTLMEPSV